MSIYAASFDDDAKEEDCPARYAKQDDIPIVHPQRWLYRPPSSNMVNMLRRALNCVCYGNSIISINVVTTIHGITD